MKFVAILRTGLILFAAAVLTATIYWSPSNIVARARKRGVYIAPQSFERKALFA